MQKTRVGIVGFGKTGKLVVNEFLAEVDFALSEVNATTKIAVDLV